MTSRLRAGFAGGALGALVLVALFYLLLALGLGGTPGFVGTYRSTFGTHGATDHVLGAALFALSGGAWGAVYGALVRRSALWKAMLFGVLPTLWFWTVVMAATDRPLFLGGDPKGLALSLFFNCVVWGSVLGATIARWSGTAHAPALRG